MGLPISVQLYTVRDELAKDFEATLEQIAAMGFKYVEFAGFYDRTAEQVKAILDRLGLKASSTHATLEVLRDNLPEVIKEAKVIGYTHIVCSFIGPERRTPEGYRETLDVLLEASEKAAKEGLTICYHNHSFEWDKLEDGSRGIDLLLDGTALNSELDVYWVKHGGDDPTLWINKLGSRAPLLHIKDMASSDARGFAEVGTGIIDMASVVKAAEAAGVKYLIIEQDSDWINGSPLESVKLSYENFKPIAKGSCCCDKKCGC